MHNSTFFQPHSREISFVRPREQSNFTDPAKSITRATQIKRSMSKFFIRTFRLKSGP